jgi:hypothetical protein
MNGECFPSLEMLKEVEIQWMGNAPHHASHISSKSCSADGRSSNQMAGPYVAVL